MALFLAAKAAAALFLLQRAMQASKCVTFSFLCALASQLPRYVPSSVLWGGGHWLGNSTIKKGCIHTPFNNWGIWSPHLHGHMHCSSPLGYQHSPFTRKPNKKTITSNNTSSKSRQKDNTTKTCLHRCWERGRDHRPGTWRCRCTLCKGRVRCMVLHLLYLCTLPVLLGLDLDNAYLIPGDLAYYKRVAQPYPAVG